MLKRLRIQFIAIIMALLTLLLGSVIGLIYHFTRQSLVKESRDMMDSLAASPFQLARLDEASNRVNLPYCMLQVNKYGEILATNGGYYDLSDEDFLQELIAVTYSSTDMQGEIPQYHLRYSRYLLQNGQRLVFVDTTSEQATLHALLRSSLLLGVAALLLFFGVSLLLARRTVQPVEAAWQQQKQFVADASHELKTPLTSLIGYADLLRGGTLDAERRRTAAEALYHESARLESLSQQLLALNGLQADGAAAAAGGYADYLQKNAGTVLGGEAIVIDAAAFADAVRSLPDVVLDCDAPAEAVVLADRVLLADLVRNLALNAWHAGPQDGAVHLRCTDAGECWRLTVQDTGCGIPAEALPHLTEPFYRVDKARARANGGSGVGLALCADIAAAFGAKLEFTSTVGEGTTVALTLPKEVHAHEEADD